MDKRISCDRVNRNCASSVSLEPLEKRALMSVVPAASSLTVATGYTLTTFAKIPAGNTSPDSLAVDAGKVFVGFGDGAAKDGSDGKSSTVVEFNSKGKVLHTFTVPGHNDGVKVDPKTHLVWALQNEDARPNLVVIDPATNTQKKYTLAAPANGGGYDDITFLAGHTYFSESNPSANPNTAGAIVQVKLSGSKARVKDVLLGNATATNVLSKKKVTLNLQDPDSMTSDLSGNLVLTSQADDELITVSKPLTSAQSVSVLPLRLAGARTHVAVDDTLFAASGTSAVLLVDQGGAIYKVTGSALSSGPTLSSDADTGVVGVVNRKSGRFTPVISGLTSARGLAAL